MNKLLSLSLKKGHEHDQVLELCDTINRHCMLLGSLSTDAAKYVKFNTNLLSHLINLLPVAYKDRWYDHVTSLATDLDKWDIFTVWLKQMEKRATAQKLSRLGEPPP